MGLYQIFEGPLEALTALALLAACVAVAYPLAALVTERHRLSHRWCATAIIASWLLTLLFYALASIATFRLPVVLSICLLLAGGVQMTIGRRPGIRGLLGSDFRKAIAHVRQPPGLLLSVAGVAVVGVRILKGLVAPPLAWDALTYHLVKAGRWVQQGGWSPDAAPDAWSYYEYFPPGGDLLWAWAMLPGHSDAFAPGSAVSSSNASRSWSRRFLVCPSWVGCRAIRTSSYPSARARMGHGHGRSDWSAQKPSRCWIRPCPVMKPRAGKIEA